MLRNYLYTALRRLEKNRLYAGIQLLGLALCLTTSLLLLRYAADEWAFDRYHEKADRLFRLTTRVATADTDDHVAFSLFVVAPRLQALYPEVEGYARLLPGFHKKAVRYGDKRFNEAHVYAADAAVLSLFTYPLLAGNPLVALAEPGSMVVSQSFACKYFGRQSPLGKTFEVDGAPYRVTGLMRDVPRQSDLFVDALLSLDEPEAELDEWAHTFLLLKPDASAAALEKKLKDFAREPCLLRPHATYGTKLIPCCLPSMPGIPTWLSPLLPTTGASPHVGGSRPTRGARRTNMPSGCTSSCRWKAMAEAT